MRETHQTTLPEAFRVIDNATVRLWDRYLSMPVSYSSDAARVYEAYELCADLRDAVADEHGLVWSDDYGWTTPEMREETV